MRSKAIKLFEYTWDVVAPDVLAMKAVEQFSPTGPIGPAVPATLAVKRTPARMVSAWDPNPDAGGATYVECVTMERHAVAEIVLDNFRRFETSGDDSVTRYVDGLPPGCALELALSAFPHPEYGY